MSINSDGPRDEIDRILIHACGDGLMMSTLGQQADLIKERLGKYGYRIVKFTKGEPVPLMFYEEPL